MKNPLNPINCQMLLHIFDKAIKDIHNNYDNKQVYMNSFTFDNNSKKIDKLTNKIINNNEINISKRYFNLVDNLCGINLENKKIYHENILNANIYIGYDINLSKKYKLYYYCDPK